MAGPSRLTMGKWSMAIVKLTAKGTTTVTGAVKPATWVQSSLPTQ